MEKIKIKENENNDLKFRGSLDLPYNDSKNVITEEADNSDKLEYFTE